MCKTMLIVLVVVMLGVPASAAAGQCGWGCHTTQAVDQGGRTGPRPRHGRSRATEIGAAAGGIGGALLGDALSNGNPFLTFFTAFAASATVAAFVNVVSGEDPRSMGVYATTGNIPLDKPTPARPAGSNRTEGAVQSNLASPAIVTTTRDFLLASNSTYQRIGQNAATGFLCTKACLSWTMAIGGPAAFSPLGLGVGLTCGVGCSVIMGELIERHEHQQTGHKLEPRFPAPR